MRYVPDLDKNLIYLGIFDQMGHNVKNEYSMMRIIKGLKVIMKSNRENDVFILNWEVVCGDVDVSSKLNINKTKLWHMKLRHIRENSFKELEK